MLKKTASFILAVLLSVNNIGTAITVNALDSENTSEVSEIDENTADIGFLYLDKTKFVSTDSNEKGIIYAYRRIVDINDMNVIVELTDGSKMARFDLNINTSDGKLYIKYIDGSTELIPDVGSNTEVDAELLSILETYGITQDKSWKIPEGVTNFETLLEIAASQSTHSFIGSCGDNAFGELDSSGTLTVTGTGVVAFQEFNYVYQYLKKLIVSEGITGISADVFSDCTYLESVSLPSSLKTIGERAFKNCHSLKSITIPEGTESIGDEAFSSCVGMGYAVLPSTIKNFGGYIFDFCFSMFYAELSEGIKEIPEGMFMRCYTLSDIIVPQTVTSIGEQAFSECGGLNSIVVSSYVTAIGESAFDDNTVIICDRSSYAAEYAGKNGLTAEYVESDGTYENTVVSTFNCGESAFCKQLSNGTFVVCGSGKMADYESYEESPFFSRSSELKKVLICRGITSVGDNTFAECENLVNVSLPGGLSRIGKKAFLSSSIGGVYIPESITEVGAQAFNSTCLILCYRNTAAHVFAYNNNMTYSLLDYNYGKCGENIDFNIDEDGTLTLTGSGNMYDYSGTVELMYSPFAYRTDIKKIVFDSDIKSIGQNAFVGCTGLS